MVPINRGKNVFGVACQIRLPICIVPEGNKYYQIKLDGTIGEGREM